MDWKYLFFLMYGVPFLFHFLFFAVLKCDVPLFPSINMCSSNYYGMKNDIVNATIPILILFVTVLLRNMNIKMLEMDAMLLLYFFLMEHRYYFIQFFNLIYVFLY